MPGLDEEEGWNGFERHDENVTAGGSSKVVGGGSSKASQAAEQSMGGTGEQAGRVADRETELGNPESSETILESPIIAEPVPLRNNEVTVQNDLFQEQLEEIDYELSKFDDVTVKEVNGENNEVTLHQQEVEEKLGTGPGLLGRSSSPCVIKDKGKNKEKGWVRRERSNVQPTGHYSSILTKRTSREENAETKETEGNKKKVAKPDITLSTEAGSQPCRNQ